MLRIRYYCVLSALALAALILGTWGYLNVPIDPVPPKGPAGPTFGFLDSFYHSLQLFVLGFQRPGDMVWQLHAARLLAPAATAVATAVLLADRLKLRWRLWRIRGKGDHRIVAGLGRKGSAYVHAAHGKSGRVIAIEKNPEHPRIAEICSLGIPVVVGDAAAPAVLKRAGLECAKELIVTCGGDDEDAKVSFAAMNVVGKSGGKKGLTLTPHMSGAEARRLLRARLRREVNPNVTLQDYCHETRTARVLFENHHLEREKIHETSPDFPSLVLLGFGRMGEAVLLQAMKIAHYPNGKPLRVHIFDKDADAQWSRFTGRYPNFGRAAMSPIADIHVHNGDVLTNTALNLVRKEVNTPHAHVTIVVALDGEDQSLAAIERLPMEVRNGNVPVLVRIHRKGGVSQLIEEYNAANTNTATAASTKRLNVSTFGLVESSADNDLTPLYEGDAFAKKIHENYLQLMAGYRKAKPDLSYGAAELPWDELPECWRDANRHAAEYAPTLFRSFSRDIVRAAQQNAPIDVQFSDPADLEIAGQMEHRRWYAERYLAGWQHDPVRHDETLHHHCMTDWKSLLRKDQLKDTNQVNKYIEVLYSLGWTLKERQR